MKAVSKKPVRTLNNKKIDDPYKVGQKFLRLLEKFMKDHDDVLRELAKR